MGRFIWVRAKKGKAYLEKIEELQIQAALGDRDARDVLIGVFKCKVFLPDEILGLNYYLAKRRSKQLEIDQEKVVNVHDRDIRVLLPMASGKQMARINWLQNMGEGYYLSGLTLIDNPRDEGHTEWMLKRDEIEGFRPLFCTLYWEETNGTGITSENKRQDDSGVAEDAKDTRNASLPFSPPPHEGWGCSL